MPASVIYHFASGAAYFSGSALVILAAAATFVDRKIVRILSMLLATLGIITAALSSTPTAGWLYALALVTILVWLVIENTRPWRRSWAGKTWRVVVMLVCVAMVAIESRWWVVRPLAPGPYQRACVLGDSISAGIGDAAVTPWPELLAERHVVEVVNLSRAGAKLRDAVKVVERVEPRPAVVVLEIGGNDLLGGTSSAEFESELRRLLEKLQGPGRALVMCELPLPPLFNRFGKIQRRLAREFGTTLIPKHRFAAVLSGRGATVDGLHLSADGQVRMAEMIWQVVGETWER